MFSCRCLANLLVVASMMTVLGGCATPPPAASIRVNPVANAEVVSLSADDVVLVMRAAGFSRQQILELGPPMRNALATAGGARIEQLGKIEAIFVFEKNMLYVSSRHTGGFVYNVNAHEFAKPPSY